MTLVDTSKGRLCPLRLPQCRRAPPDAPRTVAMARVKAAGGGDAVRAA